MSARPDTLEPAVSAKIEELAKSVLERADASELTLCTAESCTGGLLAALLTDLVGMSHVFERGFVTYSRASKCDMLGCEDREIEECGAVSRDTAIAMARGAIERSRADLAAAITGFAGPAGPDDEEGLVHFAALRRGGDPVHREEHFGSVGRDQVRRAALETALLMLKEQLA